MAALLSLLLLPKKTHVQARASIGGGRGTRPPLFSLGESIGNVPPPLFSVKNTNLQAYSESDHSSLLKNPTSVSKLGCHVDIRVKQIGFELYII